jgi:hypothetical protein
MIQVSHGRYVGLEGGGFDVPGRDTTGYRCSASNREGAAGHSIFVRDTLRKGAYDLFLNKLSKWPFTCLACDTELVSDFSSRETTKAKTRSIACSVAVLLSATPLFDCYSR